MEMSFLGMCLSVRCGSKSKNMLRLFLLPILNTCKQIFRLRLNPAALQETLIPHFHKEQVVFAAVPVDWTGRQMLPGSLELLQAEDFILYSAKSMPANSN